MCESIKENELQELILKLQENVKDVWKPCFADTTYVSKWLKARDYDLKQAEYMLRNHLTWRENENIDNILKDYKIPEVLEKFGFGGFCGHDKNGRPVSYDILGRVDPQGLLKSVSANDIIQSRIFLIEQLFQVIFKERSEKEGYPVNQIISVFDLEGFGRKHLWKPSMECIINMLKILESNYPEFMNKILIFNSPPIFKIAFNIIKPFLHHATRNKITFLRKNFKEELLKIIDPDQLPAYFGGTMFGPNDDPMCKHLIRWAGEVPTYFYLNEHKQKMISITVSPRSKIKLPYIITKEDSVLYYEFSTKDHDINFRVYYIGEKMDKEIEKIKTNELENILSLERSKNHFIIQKGELGPLHTGYYMIEFDNSYSWARSKNVRYHIEVLDVMN